MQLLNNKQIAVYINIKSLLIIPKAKYNAALRVYMYVN